MRMLFKKQACHVDEQVWPLFFAKSRNCSDNNRIARNTELLARRDSFSFGGRLREVASVMNYLNTRRRHTKPLGVVFTTGVTVVQHSHLRQINKRFVGRIHV